MIRKKIFISIIILTAIIIALIIVLSSNTRYKKISISQSQWNSIKEARNESSDLILKSIKFNEYNLIIDENNNTLYYSLINDSKTKYNPEVSFISNEKNVKIAVLDDEITDNKVFSDYKFQIMIYNNNDYHIYNLVCTDFPILNISYKASNIVKNKDKNIQMELYLFNNLSETSKRIIKSNGKIEKMNDEYIFSLFMTSPGRNKRDNKLSIFNMKPNDEYILRPLNDELINERKEESQPVEFFINDEYMGLYSLEHNIR